MNPTWQRMKSSFTVEVKRAHKRSPDVLTVTRAVAPGAETAASVFGPLGLALEPRRKESPREPGSERAPGPQSADPAAPAEGPQAPVRRVLPDLLAAAADPVRQRIEEQAAARAARRRAAAQSRALEQSPSGAKPPPRSDDPPAPVTAVPRATGRAQATVAAVEAPAPPAASAGSTALVSPRRKAWKEGLAPELRAGERWKRRLPKACW